MLKEPYEFALLGATLRACFEITVNRQYTDEDMKCRVLEQVTREKSGKKNVKNHVYQVAFFNKDTGYEFEAKMKDKDGRGYTLIPKMPPLPFDVSADDIELGKAVLQTFEACK